MLRIVGRPGGGGAALGTATVLRPPIGIPMLPARVMAEMQRRNRDAAIEPIDIVLVAERLSQTVGVTIPWGRIVGVLTEVEEAGTPALIPTVTGVSNLMQAVTDDTLVIVDGERGTVLIDPDSVSVAAFQAEKERLVPRHRFYLDFEHQPARTSDGKVIHVAARAVELEDVHRGVNGGADSVLVRLGSQSFGSAESEEEQAYQLLEIGRAASGKPAALSVGDRPLSFSALLRIARQFEFTLALPASLSAAQFAEARARMEDAREGLIQDEADFGDVRIAAELRFGEDAASSLADYLINRVLVSGIPPRPDHRGIDRIEDVITEASGILVPVIVEIRVPEAQAVAMMLGLGASGLIVAPESVRPVKDLVRTLDYGQCRQELAREK